MTHAPGSWREAVEKMAREYAENACRGLRAAAMWYDDENLERWR